jgi:hypothetical protein
MKFSGPSELERRITSLEEEVRHLRWEAAILRSAAIMRVGVAPNFGYSGAPDPRPEMTAIQAIIKLLKLAEIEVHEVPKQEAGFVFVERA